MKYFYTILYIILNGASVSMIHGIGNTIPVDLMITLSSFFALLFFHLLNYNNLISLYKKVWTVKRLYFKTIIVFLIMWIVCFLIPIYYTPAILMFFATAWPACIGAYYQYKKTKLTYNLYVSLSILVAICCFYISLYNVYPFTKYIFLLFGASLAGLTMFLYATLSYQMNEKGFKPTEILAVRFILLFIIPLAWSFKTGSIHKIDFHTIYLTLALSFASLIIPIYCSQRSILNIGPNFHSIAMGLTPFVAFCFESILIKSHTGIKLDGIFSIILFTILLTSITLNNIKTKKFN